MLFAGRQLLHREQSTARNTHTPSSMATSLWALPLGQPSLQSLSSLQNRDQRKEVLSKRIGNQKSQKQKRGGTPPLSTNMLPATYPSETVPAVFGPFFAAANT